MVVIAVPFTATKLEELNTKDTCFTSITNETLGLTPPLFDAVTKNVVAAITEVGFPEITPVLDEKDNPEGKVDGEIV